MRNTARVLRSGALRDRLAGILNVAFADGLVSEQTLSHRLGLLFDQRLVDPSGVVGDLTLRTTRRRGPSLGTVRRRLVGTGRDRRAALVLALDWNAGEHELMVGRDGDCDVALAEPTVSRRHAKLIFRGGAWVIQDLGSTNGTRVNGAAVGRCRLRPGDRIELGEQRLAID